MLISTGLGPPMCSSMSESEAFSPTVPRCRASACVRLSPCRLSEPTISQLVPADVAVVAGSVTDLFSLPSAQKYELTATTIKISTTIPAISAIRRPRRPGLAPEPPPPPAAPQPARVGLARGGLARPARRGDRRRLRRPAAAAVRGGGHAVRRVVPGAAAVPGPGPGPRPGPRLVARPARGRAGFVVLVPALPVLVTHRAVLPANSLPTADALCRRSSPTRQTGGTVRKVRIPHEYCPRQISPRVYPRYPARLPMRTAGGAFSRILDFLSRTGPWLLCPAPASRRQGASPDPRPARDGRACPG